MAENKQIKKQKEKIAEAVEREEKKEEKIVEKAVGKVEEKKENVKEAEKEVAKEISKEVEKVGRIKDRAENKIDRVKEKVKKGDKKETAVNGRDLRISTKQAVAICRFIKGKDVDRAIFDLEQVVRMKRAVPMKGEIPHRRGRGMMSGRFPVKAASEFIKLLKSLRANAVYHGIELEKVKINAMANVASRPYKRFGQGRTKRSHVAIKLIPFERIRKSKQDRIVKKENVINKKDKKSQESERSQKPQKVADSGVNSKLNEEDED